MPASLTLLPRKCFELTLEDGTVIPGQFGTYSLLLFTKKRNIGLEEASKLFDSPKITDMVDYILSAIESADRKAGRPLSMNEVKLCEWIDDYHYLTGEDGVATKIFLHSGSDVEKKNLPAEEQPGTSLSDTPLLQE